MSVRNALDLWHQAFTKFLKLYKNVTYDIYVSIYFLSVFNNIIKGWVFFPPAAFAVKNSFIHGWQFFLCLHLTAFVFCFFLELWQSCWLSVVVYPCVDPWQHMWILMGTSTKPLLYIKPATWISVDDHQQSTAGFLGNNS